MSILTNREWVRLDRDPEVLIQPPTAAHVNHEARSVALKRVTFRGFVDQASGARLRAACRLFRPELDVMLILPVLPAFDDLELDRELAAYLNWVGHGGGFLGRVYRPEPSLDRPRPAAPRHLAVEVIQSSKWFSTKPPPPSRPSVLCVSHEMSCTERYL